MRRYSIAPMMAYTDRHFRWLMRRFCPSVYLYTEMITTGAICFGNADKYLKYSDFESPVALQLGGSDPIDLANSIKKCAKYNYAEYNLNVGCPSPRVQKGSFGACLLKDIKLVADCVRAMGSETKAPITVKTRIGVDDIDSYEHLTDFVGTVAQVGCKCFIIHARKAWLKGLNPAQNRSIPPLNYGVVYKLKQDFPDLEIIINGGINTLSDSIEHLNHTDGVMLGRAAYSNPFVISSLAEHFGDSVNNITDVFNDYVNYCDSALSSGASWSNLLRHLFAFANSLQGAKQWRRDLGILIQSGANIGALSNLIDSKKFIFAQ
jgi:tRNA-dihydrouridine synthase A